MSVNHVGTRTQGCINSIPDLVVIYCLRLGVLRIIHLCGLYMGFMYVIFLRSGGCDHLLQAHSVLVTFVHISLLEFKDPAITSCLLNIIPPFKKKKKGLHEPNMPCFNLAPVAFSLKSKTCVFYTRAFSPPQGVSSILLWLSLHLHPAFELLQDRKEKQLYQKLYPNRPRYISIAAFLNGNYIVCKRSKLLYQLFSFSKFPHSLPSLYPCLK